jgi:peptide-methionine (R)-S-oxide reductase
MPATYDTGTVAAVGNRACRGIAEPGVRSRFRKDKPVDSTRTYPVQKSEEEWKSELTAEEYAVLRQAGTERAFTGEYNDTKAQGVYSCRACGAELFRSEAKFDSHCGWPSFYEPTEKDNVELLEDTSHGMRRVEVRCASCGSHLGHVFDDAPQTPTGDRYCMNSVSLRLEPTD